MMNVTKDDSPIEENVAEKELKNFENMAQQQILSFDDCPLDWWRQKSSIFPNLAMVARSYLGTPATSCASERLFSKAGYIVNKYRSCLATNNVTMLVFLATNSGKS